MIMSIVSLSSFRRRKRARGNWKYEPCRRKAWRLAEEARHDTGDRGENRGDEAPAAVQEPGFGAAVRQILEVDDVGDVFTAAVQTEVHGVSRQAMAQWGPLVPRDFAKPKLGLSELVAIVRNVRRYDDLSIKKIASLLKLVA